MRKYKANRKKARSPYATYKAYYKKVTKRNPDMYTQMYTKKEFMEWYLNAKDAKIKNPAINVARSQRKWPYQFTRRYKKATGNALTGRETKEEREQIFRDFVDLFEGDYTEAREAFEAMY